MDRKIIIYSVITVCIISFIIFSLRATPDTTANPLPLTKDTKTTTATETSLSTSLSNYIEVTDSCGPYYQGECVNLRSGPSTNYPSIFKLRTGVVLDVATTTVVLGQTWYKIAFVNKPLYPERYTTDLYVRADLVRLFTTEGDQNFAKGQKASTTKHITVDTSRQMLYAYDGDMLFMKEPISAGLELTPTPKGVFTVFKMTPSRFMQGPIPDVSDQVYDLPGVPWNLYFTSGGAVIHGAYWHDHFGEPWSHGCVNLSPENAKKLYAWAEIGMLVTIK